MRFRDSRVIHGFVSSTLQKALAQDRPQDHLQPNEVQNLLSEEAIPTQSAMGLAQSSSAFNYAPQSSGYQGQSVNTPMHAYQSFMEIAVPRIRYHSTPWFCHSPIKGNLYFGGK